MKSGGVFIAAMVLVAVPAQAQRVDLDEVHLVVRTGDTVDVTINDEPVRFRLAPDAISVPTVNADTAERLGLEPSMLSYVYVIGPTELPFRTDTVRYYMQGGTFRRRTAYSDIQIEADAQGVIGPGAFPHELVTLVMREPMPDDLAITFPMENRGRSITGTQIEIGGVPIYVAFSFDRAESLVSATGGRIIADDLGGYFDGEPREIPILYQVERPVRALRLAQPLMLGELEIRNLAVRTTDHGSSEGIDETAPEDGDPNEIVVTANTGDIPFQRLYVGLDTIGHCASITYDFDEEVVTLMCPVQPARQ